MDPIRDALHDKLTGDATLMGLVGTDEAYHLHAPRTATFPVLILQRTVGSRVDAFAGHAVKPQTWMIKAVARGDSASVAEDIDARVELLLHNTALTITGHDHKYVNRVSDVGPYDEADGAENFIHVGGLYRLITEPT